MNILEPEGCGAGHITAVRPQVVSELAVARDVEQAAAVAFDIWHTLPTIDE